MELLSGCQLLLSLERAALLRFLNLDPPFIDKVFNELVQQLLGRFELVEAPVLEWLSGRKNDFVVEKVDESAQVACAAPERELL